MPQSTQSAQDTVRQKKGAPVVSTQLFLNISEIKDNIVVLKNGGLRAILQTSSINFNLKSEEEQNGIIYAYQGFLNSLDFPIQICVTSRKLDVDQYIDNVKKSANKHTSGLLKEQTMNYAEYVEKLVEYADIMEKNFYVVVPFDPYRSQDMSIFAKFMQSVSSADSIENIKRRHKEFEDLSKKLNERVNIVKNGLESCNLRAAQLTTAQLVELFYKIYNPQTSRNQKIEDVSKLNIDQL